MGIPGMLSRASETPDGKIGELAVPFHSLKEKNMAEADRTKYLRIALQLVGLIFIVGIYPLTIVWPSGWS